MAKSTTILCGISLGCTTIGLIIFLSVYFTLVVPKQEELERTSLENCFIDNVRNNSYVCHKKECTTCGCSGTTQCATLISSRKEGACCEGKCCRQRQCQGCQRSRRICSGSGKHRSCHLTYYWDICCWRSCVSYAEEKCYISWGTCWNIEVEFYIQDIDKIEKERIAQFKCGFNDYSCVHHYYKDFKINQYKNCWYDSKHNTVSWSSPEGPNTAWIGAGFGIGMLGIGFIICMFLSYRFYLKKRQEVSRIERTDSSTPNDPDSTMITSGYPQFEV